MNEKEILGLFSYRVLSDNNNYLFTNIDDFGIIDKIPQTCNIALSQKRLSIPKANNIKLDIAKLQIESILRESLFYINATVGISNYFSLRDKKDLEEYSNILKARKLINQLILYNIENLSEMDQTLLNELINYYSPYFNVNLFTSKEGLQHHLLLGSGTLNNYTSYNKVRKID